jgi:hypothetical protein
MSIQVRVPPALAAVHNFIRVHDPDEIHDFNNDAVSDLNPGYGELAMGPASIAERDEAGAKRDRIAQAMWGAYQVELASRQEE